VRIRFENIRIQVNLSISTTTGRRTLGEGVQLHSFLSLALQVSGEIQATTSVLWERKQVSIGWASEVFWEALEKGKHLAPK